MKESDTGIKHSFLTFRIGEEEFASNVANVLEILEMPSITKVPHSPDYMRGVINLRGRVLPVLDTRAKFGIPASKDDIDTSIIVIEINMGERATEIGALVNSVEEVIELRESDMEPAPNIGSKHKSDFIQGMVKREEKFTMVLDMNQVFSESEIETTKILTKNSREKATIDS